jgi:DNA-binding transcriptional LysR family regulator
MTLEQLKIFAAVAEREHLTRAAEVLNLTPSAVSSSIRALEERYGLSLFHRVGRRIELTEEGLMFLPHARDVLASAQDAERALKETSGLVRGRLGVSASQTIAGYWLPPFLARFRERYPGLETNLLVGNTADTVGDIFHGRADIGFAEGEVEHPDLTVRAVATDQLIVVVPVRHAWADGRHLSPVEIRNGDWILREQGSGTRALFEKALAAQDIAAGDLKVLLALPSNEAVRSAVLSGEYATVMSEAVAAPDLATGRLVKVGMDLPPRHFWLLRHRERYRTKASAALEALVTARTSAETPAQPR